MSLINATKFSYIPESVCCSSDGSISYISGGGFVSISRDYGKSFQSIINLPGNTFNLACSASGAYLFTVRTNIDRIELAVYNNYGETQQAITELEIGFQQIAVSENFIFLFNNLSPELYKFSITNLDKIQIDLKSDTKKIGNISVDDFRKRLLILSITTDDRTDLTIYDYEKNYSFPGNLDLEVPNPQFFDQDFFITAGDKTGLIKFDYSTRTAITFTTSTNYFLTSEGNPPLNLINNMQSVGGTVSNSYDGVVAFSSMNYGLAIFKENNTPLELISSGIAVKSSFISENSRWVFASEAATKTLKVFDLGTTPKASSAGLIVGLVIFGTLFLIIVISAIIYYIRKKPEIRTQPMGARQAII